MYSFWCSPWQPMALLGLEVVFPFFLLTFSLSQPWPTLARCVSPFCARWHAFPFSLSRYQVCSAGGKNNLSVKTIVSIYDIVNSTTLLSRSSIPLGWNFHFVSAGDYFFNAFVTQTLSIVGCSLSVSRSRHECVCVSVNGWILGQGEIRCLHSDRLFLLADYCTVISFTDGNTDRHTCTNTHTLATHCWSYTPKKRAVLHKHKDCSLFSFFFFPVACSVPA